MPARVVVSTADVSQGDRFSYFREKVAGYFDGLELMEPKSKFLDARFETIEVGDIQICRITGNTRCAAPHPPCAACQATRSA